MTVWSKRIVLSRLYLSLLTLVGVEDADDFIGLQTVNDDLVGVDSNECEFVFTDMTSNNVDILLLNSKFFIFVCLLILLFVKWLIRF